MAARAPGFTAPHVDVLVWPSAVPGFMRRADATVFRYLVQSSHVNTLRTGDADLRFYITTVQDG